MKITYMKGNPEQIAAAGALGCMSDAPSCDIINKNTDANKAVLAESFGRGHGSVGDQANFTFSLEGVSRLVTLFLCQTTHSSFLQQSLRRAKAGGYHLPLALRNTGKAEAVCDSAFTLYNLMLTHNVPGEDARYILPLATTTNIQVNTDARELCHFTAMLLSPNVPGEAVNAVSKMISEAVNAGNFALFEHHRSNYEPLSFYPAPDLFADKSYFDETFTESELESTSCPTNLMLIDSSECEIDRGYVAGIQRKDPTVLSLLKHIHHTFAMNMSIAALHQAIRQRTWDHSVESLSNAAYSAMKNLEDRIVVPPSVAPFKAEFMLQCRNMIGAYGRALEEGVPTAEALYLLPHALRIWTLVHINGWNAIHSIGKRTCSKAQWEIRSIAEKIAEVIFSLNPGLGQFSKPQCILYGKCPEKVPCGKFNSKIAA